jgi:hypothetical protein
MINICLYDKYRFLIFFADLDSRKDAKTQIKT